MGLFSKNLSKYNVQSKNGILKLKNFSRIKSDSWLQQLWKLPKSARLCLLKSPNRVQIIPRTYVREKDEVSRKKSENSKMWIFLCEQHDCPGKIWHSHKNQDFLQPSKRFYDWKQWWWRPLSACHQLTHRHPACPACTHTPEHVYRHWITTKCHAGSEKDSSAARSCVRRQGIIARTPGWSPRPHPSTPTH